MTKLSIFSVIYLTCKGASCSQLWVWCERLWDFLTTGAIKYVFLKKIHLDEHSSTLCCLLEPPLRSQSFVHIIKYSRATVSKLYATFRFSFHPIFMLLFSCLDLDLMYSEMKNFLQFNIFPPFVPVNTTFKLDKLFQQVSDGNCTREK